MVDSLGGVQNQFHYQPDTLAGHGGKEGEGKEEEEEAELDLASFFGGRMVFGPGKTATPSVCVCSMERHACGSRHFLVDLQ